MKCLPRSMERSSLVLAGPEQGPNRVGEAQLKVLMEEIPACREAQGVDVDQRV